MLGLRNIYVMNLKTGLLKKMSYFGEFASSDRSFLTLVFEIIGYIFHQPFVKLRHEIAW